MLPAALLFFFSLFSSQGTPLRGALRVLIPRLPRSFLRASLLTAFSPLLPFRRLSSNVPIALKRVLPGAAVVGSMCPRVHLSLSAPASSRFPSYPVSFPFGKLVGSSGLEPPTSRLSGVRSNHLSYEPIFQWPSADGFAFPAPAALLLPPHGWWR